MSDTPSTTRPGSESTDLRVGERVRAARTAPAKGTWSRYAGREARVVSVNRQKFPSGVTYVEIGVSFTVDSAGKDVDAWFRADELKRVPDG